MDKKSKHADTGDDYAYVYYIKNPSYNDVSIGAWDSILYSGTPVMYETRFGLDLGLIVGPLGVAGRSYVPGSDEIRGACLHFGSDDEENGYPQDDGGHQCDGCFGCQIAKEPEKMKVTGDVDWIDHLATPSEMARYAENEEKEDYALRICREKIRKHGLNMKLVTTHFMPAEPKVVFFFTADERVDFRDLVKDLSGVFRMRIELRQIGNRDEAKLIGGLSVCGRDYCCHAMMTAVSDKKSSVTMKMAKNQNLSLNSMKISGPCGKLLCCLAYENEYYLEEKAGCPPEGTRIKLDHELWKVTEVNILSRKISLLGSEGRTIMIPFDEIWYNDETGYWQVSDEYQEELFS